MPTLAERLRVYSASEAGTPEAPAEHLATGAAHPSGKGLQADEVVLIHTGGHEWDLGLLVSAVGMSPTSALPRAVSVPILPLGKASSRTCFFLSFVFANSGSAFPRLPVFPHSGRNPMFSIPAASTKRAQ